MRSLRNRSRLAGVVAVGLLAAACGGEQAVEQDTATTEPEVTEEPDEDDQVADDGDTEPEPDDADEEQELASGGECGEFTIGFSQPLPNPAIDLIRDIVDRRASDRGNDFTSASANMDPNKQISDVDTMLQQGIDVLVAYPVDTNAITPALQRAVEADVPIVVVDTGGDGPWVSNVATGNYEAAKLAGEYLAEQLGGDGSIGIIEGPTFAKTLIDRNEGFAAAAEEAGLEVLASQTGDPTSPDAAREIADGWSLQHGDDLDGILAFSDLNALGAASAISGGFEPIVVGVNGEPQAIEAIRAGRLAATADVQPVAVALAIYHAASYAFCGDDLPATINVAPIMVTPENVDDWRDWETQQASDFEVELDIDGDTAEVITEGLTFAP